MEINSVLIATKVTLYEHLARRGKDPRVEAMVAARPALWTRVEATHRETQTSREAVQRTLDRAGIRVHERRRWGGIPDCRYDAIVVVGGDGTVLDVARRVRSTPILAVNSSPTASVGHFCCAVAADFPEVLERVRSGAIEPSSLSRIRLTVDGMVHPHAALNDVLFAAEAPAETARYILSVGGEEEEQKSSGVWISTAAGSTGAVLSAGGVVMAPDDPGLQYVVREPFYRYDSGERYRLVQGIVRSGGVSFLSRMIRGGVYIDGQRTAARIGYACRVDLTPDAPPLRIVLPPGRR
jgi:NAD+ kinase